MLTCTTLIQHFVNKAGKRLGEKLDRSMAHLPQDELPSEFDVVVDGTGKAWLPTYACMCLMAACLHLSVCASGLVQSILAAALARAGKSVLHVDR